MPVAVTNDVNLYCTHGELADELGSARKLRKIIPPDEDASDDPTLLVRQQSLRDVLKSLERRSPPISESQVSHPWELKDAVAYGALMRLYRAAMTTDGDVNAVLFREYKKKFEEELNSLRITVDLEGRVDVTAATVFRR